MKSIIEEASSISKAIDQAWQRAGKPQEFTIKVFEEPQRSIFGLTIRSAKIALFFNEKAVADHTNIAEPKKNRHEPIIRPLINESKHDTNRENIAPKASIQPHVVREHREHPVHKKAVDHRDQKESAQPEKQQQARKRRSTWSDELIDSTKTWINSCFAIMGLPAVSYETAVIGNNLNIQFTCKLLSNEQSERLLFSSFAHLIMLGLGQSYKKRFPNLKIILKSSK